MLYFQLEIPLAFSHLVHHDAGIFEVFMATAYHPKNSHCIYLDAKADEKVEQAVIGIVNCYKEKYLKASIDSKFLLNLLEEKFPNNTAIR